MGSGEAMSSERLAEIREKLEPGYLRWLDEAGIIPVHVVAARDLLAEVERLRAREKLLLTLLRAVASGEPLHENWMWQARGWLQAEEEQKGGGDGQR